MREKAEIQDWIFFQPLSQTTSHVIHFYNELSVVWFTITLPMTVNFLGLIEML